MDRYLKHQHHGPEQSLENGMTLNTDQDLARVSGKEYGTAMESRDVGDGAELMAVQGEMKEGLGRRDDSKWDTIMVPNVDADIKDPSRNISLHFPHNIHTLPGIDLSPAPLTRSIQS
jgi:hypothetical protein